MYDVEESIDVVEYVERMWNNHEGRFLSQYLGLKWMLARDPEHTCRQIAAFADADGTTQVCIAVKRPHRGIPLVPEPNFNARIYGGLEITAKYTIERKSSETFGKVWIIAIQGTALLATAELAQKLGRDTREVLEELRTIGYLQCADDQYKLSNTGRRAGGEQFAGYAGIIFTWPATLNPFAPA